MTKYYQEDQNKAERRHTIFAWIILAIVFIIIALVLWGPCDPPPPQPIPASHEGTTSQLPVTDLQDLPDLPPESTGECTGETSGTSTGTTG